MLGCQEDARPGWLPPGLCGAACQIVVSGCPVCQVLRDFAYAKKQREQVFQYAMKIAAKVERKVREHGRRVIQQRIADDEKLPRIPEHPTPSDDKSWFRRKNLFERVEFPAVQSQVKGNFFA